MDYNFSDYEALMDRCPLNEDISCFQGYMTLSFIVYFIIAPIYVVLGLSGHLVLLIAMLTQVKNQSAYIYQVILVVTETVMDVTVALYVGCWNWAYGSRWFQECPFCMWFTYRISILLPNALLTNMLLMVLAVAVDRVFALKKPLEYKSMKHGKTRSVVTALSVAISLGSSAFDYFRFSVVETPGGYYYDINQEFVLATSGIALSHMRSVVRVLACVLLGVANVVLIQSYRRYRQTARQSLAKGEKSRTAISEKTLVILTVSQSVWSVLYAAVITAYYALQYSNLGNCLCLITMAGAYNDGLLMIIEAANFYVCLAFSKHFRQIIGASFSSIHAAMAGLSTRRSRTAVVAFSS